jgi:hypothetical protein
LVRNRGEGAYKRSKGRKKGSIKRQAKGKKKAQTEIDQLSESDFGRINSSSIERGVGRENSVEEFWGNGSVVVSVAGGAIIEK